MKKVFFICMLLLLGTIHAQEKLGIVNSNYHPVSSIHMNASSSVDSWTYMQLNLVGANAFVYTNAAYLPSFSYLSFIRTRSLPDPVPVDSKRKKFLYANAVVDGPSFIMSKKNIGFGLFVRARSVVDVRRMPYQIFDILNGGDPAALGSGDFNMKNGRISNMSWAEYGGNFGLMLMKRKKDILSAGINVKYLTGINLEFLNFESVQGSYSPSSYDVLDLNGRIRTAGPSFGSGKGFGVDLGVNYKKTLEHIDNYYAHSKRSKCKYADYKYKLGVSLRDLGYVKFRSNTVSTELAGSGVFIPDGTNDNESLKQQFVVSEDFGKPVTAFLPSALAIQGDYNFENNIFLNVTLNKNILPNRTIGVQSSDLLSVTPRFETRNFEVAMPFTLQRFVYPQVGLAFRVRSFVLGFDNMVPLIVKRKTYGVGIYFNLAISILKNPACNGTGGKIDDCGHYKNPKRKLRHKSSLISPRPIKDKKWARHKRHAKFD